MLRIRAMQKPPVPTSKAPTSASASMEGKEMASTVQVRVDLFTFGKFFPVFRYFAGITNGYCKSGYHVIYHINFNTSV